MKLQIRTNGLVDTHPVEQALGADSPVSSLYRELRGRAAQAQR